MSRIALILSLLLIPFLGSAQKQEVNWLSFEQLEDSLAVKPKKVFIDFYADWCAYCKKMDKVAFRDPKLLALLDAEYYAVKMNAESRDTVVFGGESYSNREEGKKRRPNHEIALLLASRENHPFSLPAMVVLNEQFEITARYFEYMTPEQLIEALSR